MTAIRNSLLVVSLSCMVGGCMSMSRTQSTVATSAGSGVVSTSTSASTPANVLTGGIMPGATARAAITTSGSSTNSVVSSIITRQMDQQARDLTHDIPDARVDRIGDGIVVTLSTGILFEFDSDRVLGTSARNLRALSRSLDKYEGTNLLIVGHTDSLGTSTYNHDLSLRRARATAAYLTSQGVLLERMKTDGRGEQEPVADNRSEAGQARNRRVEVAIFASDVYRAKLATQNAKKK